MKYFIYTIIAAIIIGAGAWWFLSGKKSATTSNKSNNSMVEGNIIPDGKYVLSADSVVNWTGKKTLIVGYEDDGIVPVKSGNFEVINGNVVSGNIVLDMNGIRADKTGVGQGESGLEKHLKSDDFFSVESYPEASFELLSSQYSKDSGGYLVSGNLKIKDITEPVTFEVFYNNNNLSANFSIDRTIWGIKYASGKFFSDLADKVIDDNIGLSFNIKLEKQQ